MDTHKVQCSLDSDVCINGAHFREHVPRHFTVTADSLTMIC